MTSDVLEAAMRRALALAARGPVTGGNPQVGCVLLAADGTTLAEGWHLGAGTPHAEVDALSKLAPGVTPHTAVVTLEPCNHHGRTGPCTEALISGGIQRVVFAVADPGRVSGGGAARLRAAGIEVVEGVLADEIEAFLRPWLTAQRRSRPWVTVKWAQTLDGRAAAADGSSQWITGPESRTDAHLLRADSDAVLTGIGTVLTDDPALTARDADGALLPHQPTAVVVGARAVPAGARVRSHPGGFVEAGDLPLPELLAELYAQGVRRLLVEAGPTLTSAVVGKGFADEFRVYLAPKLLGGPATAIGDLGISGIAGALSLDVLDVRRLGDDLAISARVSAGSSGSTGERRMATGEAR